MNLRIKKSYFLIFISVFFCSFDSWGLDYKFECKNGFLKSLSDNMSQSSNPLCQQFISLGYAKCYDTKKVNKDSKCITLSTPMDHYYKNKESTQYSRLELKRIIRAAIKSGNDPYLSLATAIMENPPILSVNYSLYKGAYGSPPIDAIAFADVFNCKAETKSIMKDKEKIYYHVFTPKGSPQNFELNSKGNYYSLCLQPSEVGSFPNFLEATEEDNESQCCANIKVRASDDDIYQELLSYASASYMKRRFSYAAKVKAKDIKNPAEKLAIIAQAYNGYGVFGVTEKVANNCIYKMDFSKQPLYGAGAMDIMLNTLMANSEIRDMINFTKAVEGKENINSVFCQVYGDGAHKISGLAFSELMNKYIGAKPNCPRLSYAIKSVGGAINTKTLQKNGTK